MGGAENESAAKATYVPGPSSAQAAGQLPSTNTITVAGQPWKIRPAAAGVPVELTVQVTVLAWVRVNSYQSVSRKFGMTVFHQKVPQIGVPQLMVSNTGT